MELDGVKAWNLRHLKKLLEEVEGEFVRFEFAPQGRLVVLERRIMEMVTWKVYDNEGIGFLWMSMSMIVVTLMDMLHLFEHIAPLVANIKMTMAMVRCYYYDDEGALLVMVILH